MQARRAVFLWLLAWAPGLAACFKVIGVGYGGVGLGPLSKALRALGLRCYRRPAHAGDLSEWGPVLRGSSPDLLHRLADRLVSLGYDAIMDGPMDITHILLQLLDHFPHAKVILATSADPMLWFSSFQRVQTFWYYYCWAQPCGAAWDLIEIHQEALGLPVVPAEADAARCVAAYEQHNAMVREAVLRTQLLEAQAEHGWGPLCRFLNTSTPKERYPAASDLALSEITMAAIWRLRFAISCRYALYTMIVGTLTCYVCILVRRLVESGLSLQRMGHPKKHAARLAGLILFFALGKYLPWVLDLPTSAPRGHRGGALLPLKMA